MSHALHLLGRPGGKRKLTMALLFALFPLALISSCSRPRPSQVGAISGLAALPGGGGPAEGAEVSLIKPDASAGEVLRESTADSAGRFQFDRLSPGEYNLAVVGDEHAAFLKHVIVEAGEETRLDLSLVGVGAVAGTVSLSDSEDAAGVTVFVPGSPYWTVTAADGSYELGGLPEGQHNVRFAAHGYESATQGGVSVAADGVTPIESVQLTRVAPYAAFTATVNGPTVTVDASASRDVGGSALRYSWDFGDGVVRAGAITDSHTYLSSGPKTVLLTVTNANGHSDTALRVIDVALPRLRAGGGSHTVRLPARGSAAYEVDVPSSARGNLLYLEAAGAGSIEVGTDGATFASSSPEMFSLVSGHGRVSGHELKSADIRVGRLCLGPCVILPATTTVATLVVNNPGPTPVTVTLHLPLEAPDDSNEPNDTPNQATRLSEEASGALELVGDVDWYSLARSGLLSFVGPRAFSAQALVQGADGAPLLTLRSGESAWVEAGQRVMVRADAQVGGPGGVSAYYLFFE